jgi:repressor LexA
MFQLKLKELRKNMGLSQSALAKKLGVSQSTVCMWENDKNKPEYNTLIKIASFFDVNVGYLVDDEPNNFSIDRGVKIPVLGHTAGIPIEAIEEIIDYEKIEPELAASGEFFALQVRGDSMEPRMKEKDVVIVRKQSDVECGDVAVVMANGEDATIKIIKKHENGISLIANNPMYAPVFFTDKEVEDLPVSILGKVIELRAKF